MEHAFGPLVHKMDGNSRGPDYPIPIPTDFSYWSNSRQNPYNILSDIFIEYRKYVRFRFERSKEHVESYQDADSKDAYVHQRYDY